MPFSRVSILDPENNPLPDGEPGEIGVQGPSVMDGYWKQPELTKETLAGGWLHTGDIGVRDADGFFYIVDRKKDMILVSGFNVYPTDIEQVLYTHPKVQKATVVGIPDEKTGEAVKAYIVLKEGETATADEITSFLRDENGLTGYKIPKFVQFRDSLPETLVGKVLRRVLIDEEKSKAAAAGPS
jgi:long-chain acyl-CoA synthetase